jgi:transposase
MELNQEQYDKIAKYLPRQRGNVSMSNLQLVNGILYVTENGCKWRALPKSYGNWHTVYVRMNRWSRNGVLRRLFEGLQQENIIRVRMEALCLDSTSVKVHPHGTGALKKAGRKASGVPEGDSRQKFTWSPHLTARLFHSLCRREIRATRRKGENC